MKKLRIDHTGENQRIDKYLKKLLVNAPNSMIYKMLRKKDVKVNGVKVKENYILSYGDIVELFLYEDKFIEYTRRDTVKDIPIEFEVVYEDEHILIVNKPIGLLVHEDKNESVNTLTNQVLSYLHKKGDYDPQRDLSFTPAPVHRLDKNTGGMVIYGKDMRALQDLNTMMKERYCIEKKYMTIVKGEMDDVHLKGYVKKVDGRMSMTDQDDPDGLYMETDVHVVRKGKDSTLCEVSLITGRKHQIRIHLSSIGHPIIGDPVYGNRNINKKYKLDHQLLIASTLTFTDPIGSLEYLKDKTFTIKLPKAFKEIMKEIM